MSVIKLLERIFGIFGVNVNLNDPLLNVKCQLFGGLIASVAVGVGHLMGRPINDFPDFLNIIIAGLLLTLFLAFRIHDVIVERSSLIVLGTVPPILLGLGTGGLVWGIIANGVGEVHPIWGLEWFLLNVLFGAFWNLGGMSRQYTLNLASQLVAIPAALGFLLLHMNTGNGRARTFQVFADQLLRAYIRRDKKMYLHFLEEVLIEVLEGYKAQGSWTDDPDQPAEFDAMSEQLKLEFKMSFATAEDSKKATPVKIIPVGST